MTERPTTVVPLIVRDGRHPLVSLTMVACIVSGVLGLLLPSNPQSVLIDRVAPEPWRMIFYMLLCLAGTIMLIGPWLPDLRDRLIWERIGLWFFSGILLIYPLALYTAYSGKPGFPYLISCSLGIGGVWRMLEITVQLRRWRQASELARNGC